MRAGWKGTIGKEPRCRQESGQSQRVVTGLWGCGTWIHRRDTITRQAAGANQGRSRRIWGSGELGFPPRRPGRAAGSVLSPKGEDALAVRERAASLTEAGRPGWEGSQQPRKNQQGQGSSSTSGTRGGDRTDSRRSWSPPMLCVITAHREAVTTGNAGCLSCCIHATAVLMENQWLKPRHRLRKVLLRRSGLLPVGARVTRQTAL